MSEQTRMFTSFGGIRQDLDDYIASPDSSPDACNMNTREGKLSVARGFSRTVPAAFTESTDLRRLYLYRRGDGSCRYLVAAANDLYVYDAETNTYRLLYQLGYPTDSVQFDFLPVTVGSTEYLLIAYGRECILKWDGESENAEWFGSEEGLSNHPINFLEQYCGRLFAAGDHRYPNRLYWSQAPGDTRSIEDWSMDTASPDVSGGHVEVGTESDPITGLFALSNQLLIFKRDSLYRLLGDRPSNFRIVRVDASFAPPIHTACVRYGDRLFFLSNEGLYFYDGQTVRRPKNSRAMYRTLKSADLSECLSAACGDTLFFAVKSFRGAVCNNLLIEYDVLTGQFMKRNGFGVMGLCSAMGKLYLLTQKGAVVQMDDSLTYDGDPIHAHWETHRMDLGHKGLKKHLKHLFCTGSGEHMRISVKVSEGRVYTADVLFDQEDDHVYDVLLNGEDRVFRIRFENVDGRPFTLDSNVTVLFESQLRPL